MENPIDLSDVPALTIPFPKGLPGWDFVVRSEDGKTVYARAPAGFAIVMIFHSRFGHPIFPMLAMKLKEQVAAGHIQEATTSLRAIGLTLERHDKEVEDVPIIEEDDEDEETQIKSEINACVSMVSWFSGQVPLRDTFVEPTLQLDGIDFNAFASELGRRAFPDESENGPQGEDPAPEHPPVWWEDVLTEFIPVMKTMQKQFGDGLTEAKEKEEKEQKEQKDIVT